MNTLSAPAFYPHAVPAQVRHVHGDRDHVPRRLVRAVEHAEADGVHVGAALLALTDIATVTEAAWRAGALSEVAATALDARLGTIADALVHFLPECSP